MSRIPKVRGAVELAIRHKVVGQLDGVHASLHVGRSLDFFDLREYVAGDDVSDIDWRASARSSTVLVKRHVAERRSALLVAMASGRDFAGLAAPGVYKRDLALDAAASLCVLATSFGDHAGLVWSVGDQVRAARPTTRLVEVEHQLARVEDACQVESPATDVDRLLATAAHLLRRRGVVAIVADDIALDAQLEARLRRLSAQHTVLWITVPDADPTAPELAGPLTDLTTGAALPDWLHDDELRRQLRDDLSERSRLRAQRLLRQGVAQLDLLSPETVVTDVVTLVRRLRHVR